jgi:type IV pilus assembly protein PilO
VALTGQDVVNQINKAPLGTKLGVVGLLVAGITAANWFLVVSPMFVEIAQKQETQRKLEDDLIQKQSIANNLAQFKQEKEILERKLQQALQELPNEANIGELISSLSEVGNKSGLTIDSIEPRPEVRQGFYASIPVGMAVTGNYHQIGVFLDSVSKLARIVNVGRLSISGSSSSKSLGKLTATYEATAFRFLPQEGGK